MRIVPISLRVASEFVTAHHRHNKAPRGHKFSIGVVGETGTLLGAVAGRPVARALDDGETLEVTRTCTTGTPHVNSMLYGAIWRAAKAMGYRRCVTYTQGDEDGTSLRAAGWVRVKPLQARPSWAESTRDPRLIAMRDAVGNGDVPRVRWEIPAHQTWPDKIRWRTRRPKD